MIRSCYRLPDNKNATSWADVRQRVALRKSWNIQPIFRVRPEKAAHYTQRFAVLQGRKKALHRWRLAVRKI
jgi:hypothetical protein